MNANMTIPHPAADANKYTRGKLVVVAGSERYPGAAVLAARASQRAGTGYTEVVTASTVVDAVRIASPSLVVRSIGQWSCDELPASAEGKPCAVCVGPGFIGDERDAETVAGILKKAKCPVVIDGGGLAHLGSKAALKRLVKRGKKGHATVITPHVGEAARLAEPFGLPIGNPEELARGLALALHAIVVLKGPDTHVSDGKRTEVMAEGTPALAKAGTGDVLTGIIGALLAQGMDPFDAALAGATLHARAGAAAAACLTDIAVVAEDVIDSIPEVLSRQ